MQEAKIFKNGQSQAIRLPKEFRFEGDSVFINRVGDAVILISKNDPWKSLVNACGQASDDFMDERVQPPEQVRESLF
jgi:antitoxin VapB